MAMSLRHQGTPIFITRTVELGNTVPRYPVPISPERYTIFLDQEMEFLQVPKVTRVVGAQPENEKAEPISDQRLYLIQFISGLVFGAGTLE
jgi:hypothetical protein